MGEIIFLAALGLIVIGPKQMPEVARNIARFLNELKRATEGFSRDLRTQTKTEFSLKRPTPPPGPPRPDVVPRADELARPVIAAAPKEEQLDLFDTPPDKKS